LQSFYSYWGKAEKDGAGYHLLPYHCLDVAGVGHVMLSQRNDLRKRFAAISGLDETVCCQWIALFLGLHDIGKFSENFQNLRPDLLEKLQGKKSGKAYSVRHDSLGNLLWIESLWRSFEASASASVPDFRNVAEYWQELFQYIANAFTGHHGQPPRRTGPNDLQLRLSTFFTTEEINYASQYMHDLQVVLNKEVGIILQLPSPINIYDSNSMPIASWLMAGFAVLCDWIGSNSQWFQFCESVMPLDEYWRNHAIPQATCAIREAGINAASPKATDSLFADVFPDISEPTPLQRHVIECPIVDSPQLFILEDVTGSGKTEAALFLAKRLMTHGLGNGIFMALPTMATSNAMYDRVTKVYRKLFTDESTPSLVLAHGARHLSDTFMRSIADPSNTQKQYGTDEDTASAQCASWLSDNRKKALLADAGVGTLDQALLAILPSRFQSLRLLGLAGHILIVDEVHAYDPYMNKLLQTLLSFHAAMGGSAILLSATLPNHVRQEFISSFNGGMDMFESIRVESAAYPLATHLSRNESIAEVPVDATPQRITSVDVKIITDSEDAERMVISAAGQGKCVCWIRNTVHDAIAGFESLREKVASDNLMIFHARFAMGDRLDIETMVKDCFGRKSKEKDRSGKILIATQVVEQSLDLDFDLLISDLAPMDLLIQRAGRLHRHTRDEQGNPLPYGSGNDRRELPCFIIHGPLPEDDADANWYKTMFPKAATVYPSHGCLWLTARLLKEKGVLRMPDDARELIEAAFGKAAASIPSALQKRDDEAFAKRSQDRSLAHINMLKLEEGYVATPNQWLEDMRTPTRLGDTESTVRLARWDGRALTPWYPHSDFPWDMSQVYLRSFFVHSEANHTDPELRAAVEKLKEILPDKGKWSVLVPLSKSDDGVWRGEAQNKKGDAVTITYDPLIGVTVGKEEA
jgi:CRISPR-associated endonuclease/helicase Cas3